MFLETLIISLLIAQYDAASIHSRKTQQLREQNEFGTTQTKPQDLNSFKSEPENNETGDSPLKDNKLPEDEAFISVFRGSQGDSPSLHGRVRRNATEDWTALTNIRLGFLFSMNCKSYINRPDMLKKCCRHAHDDVGICNNKK